MIDTVPSRAYTSASLLLPTQLVGMIADHWGPRRSILTGCIIRAAGHLFAWLVLFGEIGAIAGPLVGIVVLPSGFPFVALSAVCLVLAVGFALWFILPRFLPGVPVLPAVSAHPPVLDQKVQS